MLTISSIGFETHLWVLLTRDNPDFKLAAAVKCPIYRHLNNPLTV